MPSFYLKQHKGTFAILSWAGPPIGVEVKSNLFKFRQVLSFTNRVFYGIIRVNNQPDQKKEIYIYIFFFSSPWLETQYCFDLRRRHSLVFSKPFNFNVLFSLAIDLAEVIFPHTSSNIKGGVVAKRNQHMTLVLSLWLTDLRLEKNSDQWTQLLTGKERRGKKKEQMLPRQLRHRVKHSRHGEWRVSLCRNELP